MYLRALIFVITVFCLTSCRKQVTAPVIQPVAQANKQISTEQALQKYVIEIGDVECDLCARAVETIFSEIPGVVQVSYESKNNSYEKGHLALTARSHADLTEKKLTPLLCDNGFMFRKISKV